MVISFYVGQPRPPILNSNMLVDNVSMEVTWIHRNSIFIQYYEVFLDNKVVSEVRETRDQVTCLIAMEFLKYI